MIYIAYLYIAFIASYGLYKAILAIFLYFFKKTLDRQPII